MHERRGRTRLLLIAEACNPTWSSVPLVGYNFARALAERQDLDITLVTHVRNRPGLAGDRLGDTAHIYYIDNEWLTGPLHRVSRLLRGGTSLSWTTGTALAWPGYIAFERAVREQFRRELDGDGFDLIHRLTPLSPTIPSPLAAETRIPMLLGPLNGGLPWPAAFPELRHQEREWLVPFRFLHRHLPYYRACYRRVAGVIAGSRHTESEVPSYCRGLRFYLPENGIDPTKFPLANRWPEPNGPFRFITVGRLVPYKAMDLVIEAMAGSAALRRCELTVVGDGPERSRLEGLARRLGLGGSIRFTGWLPQAALANELRRSQAFAFPSLREFGGGVVLEAMACGLPPIVVEHGGPAELISPMSGIALPLAPRTPLVASLRSAMEHLAGDRARARTMGQEACRHVREEFTWEGKAARLASIYGQVLNGSTN